MNSIEYHKALVGYFWLHQHEINQISVNVNRCPFFETLNPSNVSTIVFGGNPLVQIYENKSTFIVILLSFWQRIIYNRLLTKKFPKIIFFLKTGRVDDCTNKLSIIFLFKFINPLKSQTTKFNIRKFDKKMRKIYISNITIVLILTMSPWMLSLIICLASCNGLISSANAPFTRENR